MNAALLAKITGWGQFLLQLVGQTVAAGGLPASPLGWLVLVGSLGTAVATHAAAIAPPPATK